MDDAEAELGGNEDAEDQRLEYEAQFRCLLQLVAGERQRVFEACEDWREALGAWGTLVQPTMRRDDVP
jgi:nuclear pore complex protein Nup85